MSNENFAIPGLQIPSQDLHLSRARTVPAGAFLPLTAWPRTDRTPVIELFHAAYPIRARYTISGRNVSTFSKGGLRSLGIWLPTTIRSGDWLAETSINGVQQTRTIFTVGKAASWEVPVTGQVQESSFADSHGTKVDLDTDTIWRGSSWSRRLTITDSNGAAVDLADYSAWSQLRESPGGALLATLTTEIVPAITGAIDVTLSSTITEALPNGWAWWDVLLQRPDQTYDRTLPVRVYIGTGVTENV